MFETVSGLVLDWVSRYFKQVASLSGSSRCFQSALGAELELCHNGAMFNLPLRNTIRKNRFVAVWESACHPTFPLSR